MIIYYYDIKTDFIKKFLKNINIHIYDEYYCITKKLTGDFLLLKKNG
jgi:hypothetical protein